MRGELHKMDVTVQDIADGIEGRLREVVVVSHRWVSPHDPDVGTHKTGEQLEAVRAFLRKHTEILYVWFDFGCLPQRKKDSSGVVLKDLNLAEGFYFGNALSYVNLLYLSAKVLILLDGDYSTRFWCLYETFLSGHKFDGTALEEERFDAGVWRRVEITCVGSNAKDDEDTQDLVKTLHMKRWCMVPVNDFIEKMRQEDIKATNGGDKEEQLKKLDRLEYTMKTFQEAIQASGDEGDDRYVVKWTEKDFVYAGQLRHGKTNGKGTTKWPSGAVYDGEWVENKKHGRGTYKWPDGAVYAGEWKKDKWHGRGTRTWPDGAVYDGEWAENKKHGRGTYKWPDGTVYDGEFVENKRHGRGKITRPDGSVEYDGIWNDGIRKDGKRSWFMGLWS